MSTLLHHQNSNQMQKPLHSFAFNAPKRSFTNSFLQLPSANHHLKYNSLIKKQFLAVRKDVISKMRKLASYFSLSDKVLHLAVLYLDRIYTKISAISEISTISKFCLILAAKYIDEGVQGCLIEKELYRKISSNYRRDELYVLNWLEYELSLTSAYDIISSMISTGVVFSEEYYKIKNTQRFDLLHFEKMLLNIVNMFIESRNYIELTQHEIAIVLVMICRDKMGLSKINDSFSSVYQWNSGCNYWKIFEKLSKLFQDSTPSNNKSKQKKNEDERVSNGSANTSSSSSHSSQKEGSETVDRKSGLLLDENMEVIYE